MKFFGMREEMLQLYQIILVLSKEKGWEGQKQYLGITLLPLINRVQFFLPFRGFPSAASGNGED